MLFSHGIFQLGRRAGVTWAAATIVATIVTATAATHAQTPPQGPQFRIELPEPANPDLPTLFIIGDSTVRNGQGDGANGQWGWGEPLVDLFDAEKINVVNRAVGGLSSRTYQTYKYWDEVMAMLKPGDFVIMQFGHNDASRVNDSSRARGTLRGIGEETEEIDNQLTGERETVHTFGWYLRRFIADTRSKGATPIVCTRIPGNGWREGKVRRNTDDFAGWAAQVAAAEDVPLVDLNRIIADHYDAIGREAVAPLFHGDGTHTSREGAELNARFVVAGLKGLADNPLAGYLSPDGETIEAVSVSSVAD